MMNQITLDGVDDDEVARRFAFIKAGIDEFGDVSDDDFDWQEKASAVRSALSEVLNARNLAFLQGAGCSSKFVNGEELGIPTMAPLASEFIGGIGNDPEELFMTVEETSFLFDELNLSLNDGHFSNNLEKLMEVLFSFRFSLSATGKSKARDEKLEVIQSSIDKLEAFLWHKCTSGAFSEGSNTVSGLYEAFYKRLVYRDRALPRPWIFTTNYDLFNETAMDRLGLPFSNGFSGVIERRFNPATFRYALAEQLDITSKRWVAVDGFVYLVKLHGSLSWTEDDHGLYPIREVSPTDKPSKVMIFPTPAKQNASLGSPYSDLFREFQSRVVREQSVLFSVGYAFGDEHINNIIYQALTIPTFRLVIFADPESKGEIEKLRRLNDPRIWIIGGSGPVDESYAHYFDTFVERFMPELPSERIDDAVSKVLDSMSNGGAV